MTKPKDAANAKAIALPAWCYKKYIPSCSKDTVLTRGDAEKGNVNAFFNMGYANYHGDPGIYVEGLKPDYDEAVRWWRLAAEHGHAEAQKLIDEIDEQDKAMTVSFHEKTIDYLEKLSEKIESDKDSFPAMAAECLNAAQTEINRIVRNVRHGGNIESVGDELGTTLFLVNYTYGISQEIERRECPKMKQDLQQALDALRRVIGRLSNIESTRQITAIQQEENNEQS